MPVDIIHVVSYFLNSLHSNLPKQHVLYGLRNVQKKRLEKLTLRRRKSNINESMCALVNLLEFYRRPGFI
jgi:hypothetical protein